MLIIRLKPIGKKHQISYRVGVSERRSKLNGRIIEDLGFYNPQTKACNFNIERIKYWQEKGAQISDTVHNLLVKEKLIDGPKRKIKLNPPKQKEGEQAAPAATEEKKEEAPATEPEAPKAEEAVESPAEEKIEEKVGEKAPTEGKSE